jgi:hypothetical protein
MLCFSTIEEGAHRDGQGEHQEVAAEDRQLESDAIGIEEVQGASGESQTDWR